MPRELSPSEEREYSGYLALGPLEDVKSKLGKFPQIQAENGTKRKRIEELEKENGELKAKVPDGAVILTGEDAKKYTAAATEHGGLDGIVAKVAKTAELEAKDAKRTREDAIRQAAKAESWDPDVTAAALSRDVEFAALSFEVRDTQREVKGANGQPTKETVKVGFVTLPDGKAVPLADWVASNAAHLTPSLTAGAASAGSNGSVGGREHVEQRGRGGSEVATVKTQEDHRKAVESTANYTL